MKKKKEKYLLHAFLTWLRFTTITPVVAGLVMVPSMPELLLVEDNKGGLAMVITVEPVPGDDVTLLFVEFGVVVFGYGEGGAYVEV